MKPRDSCYLRCGTCLSKDLTNFLTWQVNVLSTKTFTGGFSKHTKAKGICGQLVCLTGGSISVTMITWKLFAQLTLGEISSPLGSPDTFHEMYEHSRNTNTRMSINAIAFFSAAEKNVATGEFKNRFLVSDTLKHQVVREECHKWYILLPVCHQPHYVINIYCCSVYACKN